MFQKSVFTGFFACLKLNFWWYSSVIRYNVEIAIKTISFINWYDIIYYRRFYMLIYNKNNKLIITTLGDMNRNLELLSLCSSAETFIGKENRFFKILYKDTITRSIKHPTLESMSKEAKKRFREITNVYDSLDYYDKEDNIGYKVCPYMKKPTIYSYSILYPAITEFFRCWKKYNNTEEDKRILLPSYDLSSLFASMENFKDLENIFTKEQGDLLKTTLYQEFQEFAIFYYEIYPHLNLKMVNSYDISKLINARIQVQELGLDTEQIDALVNKLDITQNNSKVLRLIKNTK